MKNFFTSKKKKQETSSSSENTKTQKGFDLGNIKYYIKTSSGEELMVTPLLRIKSEEVPSKNNPEKTNNVLTFQQLGVNKEGKNCWFNIPIVKQGETDKIQWMI